MLRPNRRARAVFISVLLGLLVSGGLNAPGIARADGGHPVYSALLSPTMAPAGTATAFSITLTQLSDADRRDDEDDDDDAHNARLGSARITAPAGFTILTATASRGTTIVSGNAVTVNNLRLHPGESVAITIRAMIRCAAPDPGTWTVIGHQTDTFASKQARTVRRNPLSQLSVALVSCRAAFVAGREPAESQVNTNISSEVANPTGPPVQVQLIDGNGGVRRQAGVPITLRIAAGTGASGASLVGTTTVHTNAAGVASFGRLSIDRSGIAYRLVATGASTGHAISGQFDIDDVLIPCIGSCSAIDIRGATTAKVAVPSVGDEVLGLSLGVETLECNDGTNHFYTSSSKVLTFDLSGSATREIVTITIAKSTVTKPAARYQVCYSSPKTSFVNRFGVAIPASGSGLLPDCSDDDDSDRGADSGQATASDDHHHDDVSEPCVLRRGTDNGGNVFVTFLTREGDPRGRI